MPIHNLNSCKTERTNRVWYLYNESLFKTKRDLIDFSAIDNIMEDFAKQNRHNVGRHFMLPNSIMEIFARIMHHLG